ncbi:DUF4350 domain-containing protein [Streptomyces sp. ISL-43]|uniref:DUF4350 domain-containing protein n=1 Tax=Streptomyces sp. ISL-43 TaxID=2819183 RepID=UPI001BEA3DA2|nr:DUF4350 domain-containing protein [Streptomyces sp. ISL-43]MBT2448389.1 DUF4350 domain-containing protein [Streptomyces sp. ISL-43]
MTPPTPGTPPDPSVPTPPVPDPTEGQAPDPRVCALPAPGTAPEPAKGTPPAAPGSDAPGTAPQAAYGPVPAGTGATRSAGGPQAPARPAATATPGSAATPGTAAGKATGGATAAPPVTPGILWTRARGFLIALAVLLAAGLTLAALNSGAKHGYLDPRSADPFGSRAVAELLKTHGVTTRVVTTAEEAADATGPDTTLLVADPDRLGEGKLRAIRSAIDLSGGRTVLLAPSTLSLPDLAPGTRTHGGATGPDTNLDPGSCALPAAASAGRAPTGGGYRYTTDTPGAVGCYPSAGHPTLLVLPTATPGGDTVLLGSETVFLNKTLAKEGNASLALQLLGSRPHLVWYLPTLADSGPDDAEDREEDFLSLIPAGWSWALLQLFVAAAVAALWRARRLGPLVTERLPVLIRASEATEGRARLYRKSDARDRAATVLRAAARERLAALVGVPASQAHDPVSLVPAVAARLTAGDPAAAAHRSGDPATLLFGTTPDTDAALVALTDQLDALEREVRTS